MSTVTAELERTAHDITTAPSFRDNAEIAIAGVALGALLGYIKHRSRHEAMKYAWWGVGLGIAGQYMVFHMLKPAMRQFGRSSMAAASFGRGRHMAGAPMHTPHMPMHFGHMFQQQQQLCPPGFVMDPLTGQCQPLGAGLGAMGGL